jgi:general L-amino acid transport system substrate-binding protein
MNMKLFWIFLLSSCLQPIVAGAADTSLLALVKERGTLRCGVVEHGPGLATQDGSGKWTGFYPDFCRALAAAVLGNTDHIEFVPVTINNTYSVLTDQSVDLLAQGRTWTLSRDADQGVAFPALYLFDGQTFMSHRASGIGKLADLQGRTVCTSKGSTTMANAIEISRSGGLNLKIEAYETSQSAYLSFFSWRCDAVTDDATTLAANRVNAGSDPDDYVILPERTAKEPLFPVVKQGDEAWANVVRWVVNALIEAEELGLTEANVDAAHESSDPEIRRFVGLEPGLGRGLGLDPGWAYRVVRATGNYGELYDRTIGMQSPLKLERGLNRLWNQGGLLWSPPFR